MLFLINEKKGTKTGPLQIKVIMYKFLISNIIYLLLIAQSRMSCPGSDIICFICMKGSHLKKGIIRFCMFDY